MEKYRKTTPCVWKYTKVGVNTKLGTRIVMGECTKCSDYQKTGTRTVVEKYTRLGTSTKERKYTGVEK